MKRREFITLLGGAAAWPLAARAQQPSGMRRIGVLMNIAEDDPATKARVAAFRQGLEKRGWSERRNVHLDYRFAAARAERIPAFAKELVGLRPDAILAHSTVVAAELQREPRAYSSMSPTRSVQASLRTWRGQAAISPACCTRSKQHRQVDGDAKGDRASSRACCGHGEPQDGFIGLLSSIRAIGCFVVRG
jgi:hypothetical protein